MYVFKVFSVFSGLNLEVLFTDLCVRWNFHSEIDLNEKKKMKFFNDSKIAVQLFNTLSSKFPSIINNLTEDIEIEFTETLKGYI